jgi:hypothetical protein
LPFLKSLVLAIANPVAVLVLRWPKTFKMRSLYLKFWSR